MADQKQFLQSQSAFWANRRVWHRAVKVKNAAGETVYRPLCGANVQRSPIVLDRMPPVGRLCANCARIEGNRLFILKRLVNLRRKEVAA